MKINIALAYKGNTPDKIAVVIASVLKNAKPEQDFIFHILYTDFSLFAKKELKKAITLKTGSEIKFYDIAKLVSKKDLKNWFIPTWYRIYLPQLLQDADRVLYLDWDVVVLDEISELYCIDFEGNYIAGCQDPGLVNLEDENSHGWHELNSKIFENIELTNYCNAGVMLFNLKLIREDKKDIELINLAYKYKNDLVYKDQDAIYFTLGKKVKVIDEKWNNWALAFNPQDRFYGYYRKNTFDKHSKVKDPKIIHFAGSKPWNEDEKYIYGHYYFEYEQIITPLIIKYKGLNKIKTNGEALLKKALQNIFSITKESHHKVLRILGLKIKFKGPKDIFSTIFSINNVGIHKIIKRLGIKIKIKNIKKILELIEQNNKKTLELKPMDKIENNEELNKLLSDIELSVIAPFPTKESIKEGWMSRIWAIDKILSTKKRVYLNFITGTDEIKIFEHQKGEYEIFLSFKDPEHLNIVDKIITKSNYVYTHTLHLAEYAEPWLKTGKIIVDIHGVTPEEEFMLGNPDLVEKYEKIEQNVLKNARTCVMVTRAMHKHYQNKYPELNPNVIILPIVENIKKITIEDKNIKNELNVIYSGGAQAWQNIDEMMSLAKKTENFAKFIMLSHDWEIIKNKGDKIKLSNTEYRFCLKNELEKEYINSDYGLALRTDCAVNRVASPTKVFEYMNYGVIPIVKTPFFGDFNELGYKYISENDFITKNLPDANEKKNIILNNFHVVDKMKELFINGQNELESLINTFNEKKLAIKFNSLEDFRRYYMFANIEIKEKTGLEIGAFQRPTVKECEGNIKFLDFYSTEELKQQAKTNETNPDSVVNVTYIVKNNNYKEYIDEKFDYIIANHVIEHISNPIKWLESLENLLNEDGALFIAIPDKKYNFDRFRTDTSLSHILCDYFSNNDEITAQDALNCAMYYDLSYIGRENSINSKLTKEFIKNAIKENHPGMHSHVFQAETFLDKILKPILYSKLLNFHIADYIYSTQFGEFIIILKKGHKPICINEKEFYKIASDSYCN